MTLYASKNSSLYNRLFDHCQHEYKDVDVIKKAYVKGEQIYAIDYYTTNGVNSIAENTANADKTIIFQ